MNKHTQLSPLLLMMAALVGGGCATTRPVDLVNARVAYDRARAGKAPYAAPADLQVASVALDVAEDSYETEGDSAGTQNRSYVALRRAQIAEARAEQVEDEARLDEFERYVLAAQQRELAVLRAREGAAAAAQNSQESDRQTRAAAQDLARVGAVREDQRGMIVTLSGGMLFPSGKSELMASARDELSVVATALKERAPRSTVVIEGHSDSRGAQDMNLLLSAKRAEAVRDFLVAHGVAEERIDVEGLGYHHPIASNGTAKGRASNRRVEIVLLPQTQPQPGELGPR
jgi:outer membrane protein OmpA-like peptidoglycan-associated protein